METYLKIAVLFVVFLGHCSYSCPIGTYGFQCGYQCHCLSQDCDSSSGCNSGNCFPGWSGATCHTYNAALNKPVSSSGDGSYPSDRATDGQISDRVYQGCIETKASNPNWWRVDLVDSTLIRDITIYFRIDYSHRRNGIQVYLTNTTATPSGPPCYTVSGDRYGTDINDTLSVPCHGRGRYVLLYTATANEGDTQPVLDFCEVEVNVCDAGTFGADCENYCHCKHGVCNDMTGVCTKGRCLAGWKGTSCDVKCVQGMEYGFGCLKTCSTRMCQGDTITCPRETGRCTDGCQAGWKGEDCTTECIRGVEYGVECAMNCSTRMCQGDTSTCPRETGRCTDGCQVGWSGVDCTSECIDNVEYGHGCGGTCSARKCKEAGSSCPLDTGRCDGGCQAGWEGVDCTSVAVKNCSACPGAHLTECTTNVNYGLGCHGNCSARKCKEVSGTCPRRTGRCEGGCQAGWEGADCTLKCQSRTFGVNCSFTCGHCVDDEPCHHVTGTCLKGCSSGWVSDTCRQAVNSSPGTSTGRISPLAAGFTGAFAMLVIVVAVCLWRKGDFRMAKNSSKESRSPETNPAPPVEVPAYDVLPEHDYTKLDRIHTEHYDTLQPTGDYQNNDVRI